MNGGAAFRSGAWFGDRLERVAFPSHWDVDIAEMADCGKLSLPQLCDAIDHPIGAPPLAQLAGEYRSAIILCEDHTRPLDCHDMALHLLTRLNEAGIADDGIRILIANGTHRPMSYGEQIKKFGLDVCKRVSILAHNCYGNLRPLGTTDCGTPVSIDRQVGEEDLVIGIGGIYPHGMAGFSGGAKIVLPGICGIDTIEFNHSALSGGYLNVEENGFRSDMEQAARMVPLRFSINAVINSRREICGVYAGDFIAAHRQACSFARRVYATKAPEAADVLFINAYPMDSELFQAAKALEVAKAYPGARVLVLMASCDEGFGHHWLCGPGGRMHAKEREDMRRKLEGRELIIVSPNIGRHDILKKFPPDTLLFEDMARAVTHIEETMAGCVGKVLFFPCAPIQVTAPESYV